MNGFSFRLSQLILVIAVGCGSPFTSAASYSYTANSFDTIVDNTGVSGTYTTEDSLSIYFIISALPRNMNSTTISPASYIISDGRNTIDEGASFSVSTDSNGDILDWSINAGRWFSDDSRIYSTDFIDSAKTVICVVKGLFFCAESIQDTAEIRDNPGIWITDRAAIPLPAATWLFGSALLGLGVMKRKKT